MIESLGICVLEKIFEDFIDVLTESGKKTVNKLAINKAFLSCGEVISQFENDGKDSLGENLRLIFSKESLQNIYKQLKTKPGYDIDSFLRQKLESLAGEYNINANNFIETFIKVFHGCIYWNNHELYSEIYQSNWREEDQRFLNELLENQSKQTMLLDQINMKLDTIVIDFKSAHEQKDSTIPLLSNPDITSDHSEEDLLLKWELNYPKGKGSYLTEDEKRDRLLGLTQHWKGERVKAPSWYIIPYNKRYFLKAFTCDEELISSTKMASTEELFEFAYELVWRYESAFITYSVKLRSDIYQVWDQTNCDIIDSQKKELWFNMGYALLRDYREDLDIENWQKIYERLWKFRDITANGSEELSLEKIKLLFMQMKISATKEELITFRGNKEAFGVRLQIAGLKAECGLLTEAFEDLKKLENDLLDKIQSDANKKNHVLYKSVLSSVYYMQSFVFQGRNPFDRGNELKDIWKRLETYKQYFDFDLEKQRYEHELYRALKKEKRAEAFEINREKKTVIYTNNRFSEVYDFFRLLDRNAIPLHIGYTRLLDEDESDFVKILLEDYSYIGWFTLFRFGTTKTIEKVLGRRECIILNSSSENGLKRGFDYIYNAVNENIGSIQGISKRYHGDAYDHILSNGLEILKRLSSTTNLLGQKKLIRLMCKLIDTDIVKEYQVLDKWIRHIMYITEDRVKAVMLNELLTCSVKERKYNTGENPIDPFDVFPVFEDAKHFYRATDVEPDIVDTMLSKAFSDEKKKRYLVPRLGQMEDWKLLTDIQRERFASILWENIPDDSSLPYEEYYFPHVFLKWAHPREIDVVEIVKHKLLDSKNFEKLKSQQLSAITFGDNIYLRQIKALNITVSDFWEIGEIQLMMNGFLDYWEALHEGFSKVKHAEFYKDEFVSRSKELLHTIFSFCREQMQQMDSVIVERVKKMTNKMREYGIDTVELAVLFTPTEGLNQVIEDVINGLRSVDASKVLLSVNAAEKILRECGQKNDVYNIFNEMLILCLYRKEPGLEYCLIAIHNILYSVKDINLDEKILDMLYEILDNIDEQTSYEKNIEKSEKEIKNLVKIRIACASLAYQLYQYEMRKDICQSDAVLNWKNICRGKKSLKEFAEVKRRWFE